MDPQSHHCENSPWQMLNTKMVYISLPPQKVATTRAVTVVRVWGSETCSGQAVKGANRLLHAVKPSHRYGWVTAFNKPTKLADNNICLTNHSSWRKI